ncbi:uncharacterized protein PHACADRAFT_211693 [Phanerochaete carnosa HHB-10118-sp]|uniref:FAD-binding PCMH-type domain-containing protein n=1 Tax=Phanerochaete carnosa (strain HHB-10118-sp) TaxID=650164 RepID=K5W0P0_PHACS|nr:uncharacterized protein PHACADRAFT_211693 [Phanerochaete carnosa HHB-10118-sp]EKM52439.1 hypothetical protein PHACADRAFT_211693 [Phanerochaete carnosa HHB-10118-sp]
MHLPLFTGSLVLSSAAGLAVAATTQSISRDNSVCSQIQSTISNQSSVYLPGQSEYDADQTHYFASSSQPALCTVEPKAPNDVSLILQVLAQQNTPFAIKGGGHTGNPGFSSTSGVLLSMNQFNTVQYHASNQTADVGVGLVWDDVYEQLQQFGVTVVGGRVSGIGVAGLTLGGGYSWLTNQYGLVVDNVVGFQVVLPNGNVVVANAQTASDLFFALKGGYNNFGVVTQITFKTYPIGQVWGGYMVVLDDQLNAVTAALNNYIANVQDPKAALIASYTAVPGQLLASLLLFYDGPTPPAGIFDDFLNLTSVQGSIGTRSFLELVQTPPSSQAAGSATRGYYDTATIASPTGPIIDAIVNETTFWSTQLASSSAVELVYSVEVFLPNILQHAPEGSSAYPPTRSTQYLPLAMNFQYTSASDDALITGAMASSAAQLGGVAAAQGQNTAEVPVYGNYATTQSFSAERIFGANLAQLQSIKQKYDPSNVMGLTGGWKI